jgi:hypothetical protein
VTIRLPAAPTGRALSVVGYGATPGRNSNDASAAFRRAINAARSGDEILVPKGSYVFKRPNVVLKSGQSVAVITTKFTTSSAGSSRSRTT